MSEAKPLGLLEEIKKGKCIVCGRIIGEHSPEELEKCVQSFKEPKVLKRIAIERGWNVKFSEEEENE